MHRVNKFVLSHRPYALDLSSFQVKTSQGWKGDFSSCTLGAVWFNRKDRVTRACVGELSGVMWGIPTDVHAFLAEFTDGRYGGNCHARWDGANFWAAGQDPEENARLLALLKPMLAAYPECPAGWDGWWRF